MRKQGGNKKEVQEKKYTKQRLNIQRVFQGHR